MGLKARQDFRVINLWELDVNLVFQDNLVPLLPFVPILKGGGSPELLQRALIQLQQDEELEELESLLAFFASFVLDTGVIQPILRWDMAVLRESPWYQEILLEGENRGLEKGLEQGLEQGRTEEALALVLRQLTRRIGAIAPESEAQIRNLSLEQIEALGEALLDFSDRADLDQWLKDTL